MDLALTESQGRFRDEVRAFIDARLPEALRQTLREGGLASRADIVAWQRTLNERGWAVPHWPVEYGGANLGAVERLLLIDELARAPAPMPLVFNVSMIGPLLLRYGTEDQKRSFLPKLANLDLWFCQGFSEPDAGSDLASLRTAARIDGDSYVVDGQKTWTTFAHRADWIFCLVRTEKSDRKQNGITFLLIDLKTPGITVRPIRSIDGGHHLNEVFFEGVRVPVKNRVGEEGRGWDCAKYLLANERTGVAGVGLCRERLGHAVALARSTMQGGRSLIEDDALCAEIALLDAETRALELTNWRFLTGPADALGGTYASLLKLKGTDLQQRIAALLARISGPASLTLRRTADADEPADAPYALRYFASRATSIYGGATEVQKDIMAKSILG